MKDVDDLTRPLNAAGKGERLAAEHLLPLVYEELRKLAAAKMAKEAASQTLQATALVHEAWIRLSRNGRAGFDGRAHFFAAAAETMRRILIDRARRKRAVRHGGGLERLDIEGLEIPTEMPEDQLLALNEALDRFAERYPVAAETVKLRYFAGMSVKEAAAVLGISTDTAKDNSAFARAWLHREISANNQRGSEP